jgi:hypothetical protein
MVLAGAAPVEAADGASRVDTGFNECFPPHPATQSKQVLQQNPAIQGFAPTSHLPQLFCCEHVYVPGGGGTSVQLCVEGGEGGIGEGPNGGKSSANGIVTTAQDPSIGSVHEGVQCETNVAGKGCSGSDTPYSASCNSVPELFVPWIANLMPV